MKVDGIIVVEGKTDTNKLQSFLDVDTIETNGSEISSATLELIRQASLKHKIIIFTDPDAPGKRIRQVVSDYLNNNCYHAYLDKSKAIAKNKVGIAQANAQDLMDALNHVVQFKSGTTSMTLAEYHTSQSAFDANLRKRVCHYLNIEPVNNKTFYKRLNYLQMTIAELKAIEKQV